MMIRSLLAACLLLALPLAAPSTSARSPAEPSTASLGHAFPPTPPQNAYGVPLPRGQIGLLWDPPAWDGGAPIDHYDIYRAVGDGVLWYWGRSHDTGFLDSRVETNVTYSYEVFAVNSAGMSPPSNLAVVRVTYVN